MLFELIKGLIKDLDGTNMEEVLSFCPLVISCGSLISSYQL